MFGEHILSVASGQISLDTCMDYAVHKYIYIDRYSEYINVYIYTFTCVLGACVSELVQI